MSVSPPIDNSQKEKTFNERLEEANRAFIKACEEQNQSEDPF
jgi:hypothetical protein